MLNSMPSSQTVLRIREVTKTVGLSRSTIYDYINPNSPRFDPSFPRPIRLSASKSGAVGWYCSEVQFWINSRRRVT